MSGFSADWLALRAGADARARDPALVARLAAHLEGRALRILDLGAGTGASLRALAPMLGPRQHWVLAEGDAALLDRAEPVAGTTLEPRVTDLAAGLETLFEPAPDLVTTAAFLDLCGAAWLEALAARAAAAGAVVYAALSYDGREAWTPPHPLDARVRDAFHADQRRDKGLGSALGPAAHDHLARSLRRLGYRVAEARSDWHLARPTDAALIRALAEGTAAAIAPRLGARAAADWRAARVEATDVLIGHRDLLASPPGKAAPGGSVSRERDSENPIDSM